MVGYSVHSTECIGYLSSHRRITRRTRDLDGVRDKQSAESAQDAKREVHPRYRIRRCKIEESGL